MSTSYLLSTHSSNPLEAPASDKRNRAFVRKYQATKAQPDIESDSSEDEKNRRQDEPGTVQAYRTHIAELYPEMRGKFQVRGLGGSEKENARRGLGLGLTASTSKSEVPQKVDIKGKGKAVDVPVPPKQKRGFVDLDEDDDMSDAAVPGVGECQLLLGDEEEDEDERNDMSQGPAGSDGAGHGSDVDIPDPDGDPEDEDDDIDLDSDAKVTSDVDDADSSSSSTHLPSSSLCLLLKPPEEQQDIQREMADLEHAVPVLAGDYRLVDRLGSGTFSSVYKAIDLHYDTHDNSIWKRWTPDPDAVAPFYFQPDGSGKVLRSTDPAKERRSGKVYVAVKRIYVTSAPERVRNELSIMEDCRGSRHTSQLITAFRHQDQVVAVMPYCRNEDFRHYYRTLPLPAVKEYFRCMFRALNDTHRRGIIHRDVKPANFLFDPRTGVGTLCDFGLASRMELRAASHLGACLHTGATRQHPHGKLRSTEDYDAEMVKKAQRDARSRCLLSSDRVGYPERDPRPPSKANRAGTRGFRAPEVLLKCSLQTGAIDVWSAGIILLFFLTKKFPLFQASDDVEALMEIATIFGKKRMERAATLHSRVFQTNVPAISQDGITWSEFVEKLNPDIHTPPSDPDPRFWPYCLEKPSSPAPTRHPPTSSSPASSPPHSPAQVPSSQSPSSLKDHIASTHELDVEHALSLAQCLLHHDAVKRLTPAQALEHPFLRDPSLAREGKREADVVPHPFGQGVCEDLHVTDSKGVGYVKVWRHGSGKRKRGSRSIGKAKRRESGEGWIRSRGEEYVDLDADSDEEEDEDLYVEREVLAGEGIAIGREPCEFHRAELGYKFDS